MTINTKKKVQYQPLKLKGERTAPKLLTHLENLGFKPIQSEAVTNMTYCFVENRFVILIDNKTYHTPNKMDGITIAAKDVIAFAEELAQIADTYKKEVI